MQITGSIYILFAYDIGLQCDVDACSRLIGEHTIRTGIESRHRAPKHFDYRSKPLRLTQKVEPIDVLNFRTTDSVDLVLHDFGAVSLTYNVPFTTNLEGLLDLSSILYDYPALQEDSKKRVEAFLSTIRPAVTRPDISGFVEDYLIFEIKRNPLALEHHQLLKNHQLEIAQILRSEKLPLSSQEIDEALSEQISYTPGDTVIVNWNAAFIYDDDAEDVRNVIEFINLQLLEMRYLDRELDKSLDKSYDLLSRRRNSWLQMFHTYDAELKQVAQMQTDGALLFEGVSSALKLLGDQYLSRVYSMAARRFYLRDWDKSINHKLSILDNIYQKLEDKIDSARMEILELIIVLLIVFEIVMPFLPKLGKLSALW